MKNFFQGTNRLYLSTTITVFAVCYTGLILLPGFSLLQDPDTFWHIRTGQWILDHAQFPTVDVFSYTANGKAWISTEWIPQIFFAIAYKFGGWRAVVVVTAVCAAAAISILGLYLVRWLRFSVVIGWTALTMMAIGPHLLARPHIFSYVLMAIWMINLLDSYDDDSSLPSLRTLVPLIVLWANVHGSFTFGLALLGIFAVVLFLRNIARRNYAECRHLILTVCIVSAGALLTPYGISPAFMTLELLDLKYTIPQIVELRAPDFQVSKNSLFFFSCIVAAVAGFGIRLSGARLITFICMMIAGLSYARGLLMFFFLAPFILARPLAKGVSYLKAQPWGIQFSDGNKAEDPVLRYLHKRFVAVPTACMTVAALVTASTWWREDIVPAKSVAPKAAIDFVQHENITGNVFNDYNFGGFLVFLDIPTFVDGRALPFGDDFLHKYFDVIDLVDTSAAFKMLDDYKVSWIILRPTTPLTKAITESPFWDKVFSDAYSVVFTRHR